MNKVKGWKCFDKDMTCLGFKFEVGNTYEHKGDVELCKSGFHFHENPEDVFTYYDKDYSVVCEVEAYGVVTDDDKSAAKKIKIIKKLQDANKYLLGDCYGSCSGYDDSYGSCDSYGDGYGYGDCYGDGSGYGSGYGYDDGSGSGYGYDDGSGFCDGSGSGDGYGYGSGYGYGYGDGDGYIFLRSYQK